MTDPRRGLPAVDRLLREPEVSALLDHTPREVVLAAVRESLTAARESGTPAAGWAADIAGRVHRLSLPSLRPVLNATGVVLHTNLGRAPLAAAAIRAIAAVAAGYSTLELDLESGRRGSRTAHCARLLSELAGADDALVVNNAAAALVLALNTVAHGREVPISRGELIEIGGAFRIPDIMGRSGAILREVGTTNRTHLADYAAATGNATGALLTVHRSNFEQRGFVASPAPADLAALAREHGVPYLYDVGSGLLADLAAWGLTSEPRVRDAVASGADLVIFSGDKLLGGPQAGCLVGRADLVAACRANPLARAMRADKMTLAGLEATLALYRDPDAARREIPVLRMLTEEEAVVCRRAEALAAGCPDWTRPGLRPGQSAVGGGSFPEAPLPTRLVALQPEPCSAEELARRLRLGTPPVLVRVNEGRLLLDPRTLTDADVPLLAAALAACRDP
jgi:L-seryl-tRNA(Ser) seleniumtransferase